MQFHDKAANKAVAMGKRSVDFKNAAQKHANGTWVFLIAAGAVWYFWGWQVAVIPAVIGIFTAFQSISSTMIAERIEELRVSSDITSTEITNDISTIIGEYGKVLEKSAPSPGCAADVSKLPYPKQVIKSALISGLNAINNPQMQQHFKIAFINLSRWQEGVGESDQGINISEIDRNQDAEAIAKALKEQSSGDKDWGSIILNEQRELEEELINLGFINQEP